MELSNFSLAPETPAAKARGALRKSVVMACAAALGVTLTAGSASADQLKIADESGVTKLIEDVASGSTSQVRVAIGSRSTNASVEGVAVRLWDPANAGAKMDAATNNAGVVRFNGIAPGLYHVALDGSKSAGSESLFIGDVSVESRLASSGGSETDSQARNRSRALYAVGASAVAGTIGIVAASDSSSSNSSTGNSDLGFVNSDGATVGGSSEAELVVSESAPAPAAVGPDFDMERPDVNTIAPAPTNGTVNDTPSFSTNPGDPTDNTSGGGNSPQPETPNTPTDPITPAPDPVDPMTPS